MNPVKLSTEELFEKYEQYFSTKNVGNGFKAEKLGFDPKYNLDQIAHEFNKSFWAFQRHYFLTLMRVEWIDRNIVYDNQKVPATKRARKGQVLSTAFKQFWLRFIGFSRMFFGGNFHSAIRSYANDFFPNFDDINALDYDFPYPFEYMKLECLLLVHKLPDRMEFLREGERKRMSISEFEDYLGAWMSEMAIKHNRKFQFFDVTTYNYTYKFVSEILPLSEVLKRRFKK
jgi:hypothetical protein